MLARMFQSWNAACPFQVDVYNQACMLSAHPSYTLCHEREKWYARLQDFQEARGSIAKNDQRNTPLRAYVMVHDDYMMLPQVTEYGCSCSP